MKEVKIEIPKGYEVDKNLSTFEKIVFKQLKINITERVRSLSDALQELGEQDTEIIEYRKMISANLSESTLKLQEGVIVIKALNEGWYPDWENNNEYKYFMWWDMQKNKYDYCVIWSSCSSCPSRLCLKTADLCVHMGKYFPELCSKIFK